MAILLDATHRFCVNETAHLHDRIWADLETIVETLLDVVPGASIVLSGSLAYGEGNIESEEFRLKSDYDLYLVIPGSLRVGNAMALNSRCVPTLLSYRLLTDLEIVVLWWPLVWRGLTHISGILLAGNPSISSLLEHPRAFPHGDRALCRAYASLLGYFRTDADRRWLDKAVQTGFRAWLLETITKDGRCRNRDLFSFQGNLNVLSAHPKKLPEPWHGLIERTLLAGLGRYRMQGATDPDEVLAFLRWLESAIPISSLRWVSLLYMVFQASRRRSFVAPNRFSATFLQLARSVAEIYCQGESVEIPDEIMRGVERLIGTSNLRDPRTDRNAWLLEELITMANVNPHKIVVRRQQ